MTEAEWLACVEPTDLLEYIEALASERQFRLLACAFCRMVWETIPDDVCRTAVEVAERFVDGRATKRAVVAARKAVRQYVREFSEPYYQHRAAHACLNAIEERAQFSKGTAINVSGAVVCNPAHAPEDYDRIKAAQGDLIRDLIRNPFRPLAFHPGRITPAITGIAWSCYDQRILPSGHLDCQHLAVLSDALEEAGCMSADMLAHLRSPGPHVRGCWALDLILGKW